MENILDWAKIGRTVPGGGSRYIGIGADRPREEKNMALSYPLYQKFMTKNRCYKQGLKLPKSKCRGLVVHSTASKGVMAAAWFNRWNNADTAKLVSAFIDDKECWQYAPWDMYGAHCGGAANASHTGFEICEDKTWTRPILTKPITTPSSLPPTFAPFTA